METIKEKFLKYWFLLSTLALTILYFLFERRGRNLAQVKAEAETNFIAGKIAELKTRSMKNEQDFLDAATEYRALKSSHPGLLRKLGVGPISKKDH